MLLVKSDERCCSLLVLQKNQVFLLPGRVFQLNMEVSIKIDSSTFFVFPILRTYKCFAQAPFLRSSYWLKDKSVSQIYGALI